MAKIIEWTDEQRKRWDDWVATRPPVIQELCRKFPPDRLYKLKSSGHRGTLHSYLENGTVTVDITGEYNVVMFDRRVFGIEPDDLEECDLIEKEAATGTVLTDENEVKEFIDFMRPLVLPERDARSNANGDN